MVFGNVRLVTLQINAQRRALGAGTGQAEHDARTVGEDDAHALAGADAAIYGVGIAEIVAQLHLQMPELRAP